MRLARREVASRIIGVAPPMIGECLGESFRIILLIVSNITKY